MVNFEYAEIETGAFEHTADVHIGTTTCRYIGVQRRSSFFALRFSNISSKKSTYYEAKRTQWSKVQLNNGG